jgi:hypothetical protein
MKRSEDQVLMKVSLNVEYIDVPKVVLFSLTCIPYVLNYVVWDRSWWNAWESYQRSCKKQCLHFYGIRPSLLFTLTLTKIKAFFVQSLLVSKNVFSPLLFHPYEDVRGRLRYRWKAKNGPQRRLLWRQNSNSNLHAGISNVRLRDGGIIKVRLCSSSLANGEEAPSPSV